MSPSPLIAHINLAKGFRGGERQTELLIRGLAADGWRQRLVARRGESLAERVADLNTLDTVAVAGNVIAAAFALRGADLVHVHEARALQAAYLQRMLGGAPYLITRRVQQGPSHHALNRAMYRRAAFVAVLSGAIGASVQSLIPGLRFEIIPSASAGHKPDPGRVAAIRRQFGAAFIVGHVGALVDSHKGQRQIIAVAREVALRSPDVAFVLVGGGRDGPALRAEAQGIANLHFAGETREVGNYLAAFDLFLYPSRHEGLGSTLLDAMSFGLPVVATAVGGIPEIVTEGVNGLLCEPDDIAGLAAAVLTLRADPDLQGRMSAANRKKAEQFSPQIMTRRYAEAYKRILPGATGATYRK